MPLSHELRIGIRTFLLVKMIYRTNRGITTIIINNVINDGKM